jgi:hypothetical protein
MLQPAPGYQSKFKLPTLGTEPANSLSDREVTSEKSARSYVPLGYQSFERSVDVSAGDPSEPRPDCRPSLFSSFPAASLFETQVARSSGYCTSGSLSGFRGLPLRCGLSYSFIASVASSDETVTFLRRCKRFQPTITTESPGEIPRTGPRRMLIFLFPVSRGPSTALL